jgi:hypothetical protein
MTARPDTKAALLLSGAAIIVLGLSLRWYTASLADIQVPGGRTGWSALDLLDVYLTVVAAAGVALVTMRRRLDEVPFSARGLLTGAAALGLVVVAYRVASPSDDALPGFVTDPSLSIGPFVTTAGLVLLVAGARCSPVRA